MTLEIWFAAALLLTLNLVAFLAQGIDKRLARNGSRRIPEKRLLWLGVPLAAPGMWLGMRADATGHHPIWRHVLACLYAYGAFLGVLVVAAFVRHSRRM